MKSKFLTFACIFALVFAACAFSAVNAATVTAADTVKTGDTVTVTFDFGKAVSCGEFYVTYDTSVLELVTNMPALPGAMRINPVTPGNVGFIFSGTNDQAVSSFTLEFKVVGANGTSSVVTLVPTAGEFRDTANAVYEVATASKTVTVGEVPAEDPGTTPDNPPAENPPAEDDKPADETPTKYPQTGVNVAYVAAGIALAVVAGYVVVKKH